MERKRAEESAARVANGMRHVKNERTHKYREGLRPVVVGVAGHTGFIPAVIVVLPAPRMPYFG